MRGSKNSSSGGVNNQQQRRSSPLPVNFEIETLTTNSFEKYSALNDQLLRLILLGEGDGAVADDVRDLMDEYWYKMSLTEQNAIRQHNETALGDK